MWLNVDDRAIRTAKKVTEGVSAFVIKELGAKTKDEEKELVKLTGLSITSLVIQRYYALYGEAEKESTITNEILKTIEETKLPIFNNVMKEAKEIIEKHGLDGLDERSRKKISKIEAQKKEIEEGELL